MDAGMIREFWDWFRDRADQVREDPRRLAPEISDRLGRLDGELGWEMGRPGGGTGWDFIVRSEDPAFRIAAHEVVVSAPAIEGWRFLEWRPGRASESMTLKLGEGRVFSVAKVTASVEADAKYPVLRVVLSSPEFGADPKDDERYAGYLMLDAILGERVVEDAVESVGIRAEPEGPVPAMRLKEEVDRRLREVRGRPGKVSDDWAILQGEAEGKPVLSRVNLDLDLSKMASHPWRVDVAMGLKAPDPDGFPAPGELSPLEALGERLGAEVAGRTSAVPWRTRTSDGVRTMSFYVAEPLGLREGLRAVVGEAGYESEVRVTYDSRWKDYRQAVG